ncbi:MAG: DUF2892 domain-containing protein [Verrucomicrobia bacterium]|nr:DUF2892 domain-containing protein [Verrucomicrobiota bacterium]
MKTSSLEVNERNRRRTEETLARYASASPEAMTRRITELETEWDIERALEANAATVTMFSAVLALSVHRKWAWLTLAVGAFLLQHALQGWCPPLPILRRMGVRTASEIQEEKTALRLLRGDFHTPVTDPAQALAQVRKK